MCCVMPPASPAATLDFADDVEQRGFAVVNVAHDGDDRRARLEFLRLVLDVEFDFLTGAWTTPPPRSRFSTSKRKPYLAQTFGRFFRQWPG